MIGLRVPGDKSVSHRALLLAPLADGESRIEGLGDGADVRSSLAAMRALGARIETAPSRHGGLDATVHGGPLAAPGVPLDCGNSGTTARLLAGILAGTGLGATLDGDRSLRQRPMRRVIYPLQAMGLRARYLGSPGRLPVRFDPRATGTLRTLRHRARVASAQVKSALLLAGATARVRVSVVEPARSRDHTERMLRAMGAPLETADTGEGHEAILDPAGWDGRLAALDLAVPGDPSSAAFLVGAALLADRELRIEGVSENPTRTAFLDVLADMGVRLARSAYAGAGCEPTGDWVVRGGVALAPFDLGGARIPSLIDELPLLSVLATRAGGRSVFRDAGELRVKESDRIGLLARNLSALGVRVEELSEGLAIHGTERRLEGVVETGGDHRMAMAFGVLGVDPRADIQVDDPDCAGVSFPGFWDAVDRIRGG